MFSFLAILLNWMDWPITGRKARVQFYSTLERKVKTRALKGIFLVRKSINNTLKSNSVRYHMHHRKNISFLSSFGLPAVFVKGSKIAVFVSIVTSKRARWPPLFIIFLSCSWLVTSVYQVSSAIYVRFFYYGIILRVGIKIHWSLCSVVELPRRGPMVLLNMISKAKRFLKKWILSCHVGLKVHGDTSLFWTVGWKKIVWTLPKALSFGLFLNFNGDHKRKNRGSLLVSYRRWW